MRRVLLQAALKERTTGTRIDERSAELAQYGKFAVDDVDAFFVGLGEQRLVHVFAHDADAHAGERLR